MRTFPGLFFHFLGQLPSFPGFELPWKIERFMDHQFIDQFEKEKVTWSLNDRSPRTREWKIRIGLKNNRVICTKYLVTRIFLPSSPIVSWPARWRRVFATSTVSTATISRGVKSIEEKWHHKKINFSPFSLLIFSSTNIRTLSKSLRSIASSRAVHPLGIDGRLSVW